MDGAGRLCAITKNVIAANGRGGDRIFILCCEVNGGKWLTIWEKNPKQNIINRSQIGRKEAYNYYFVQNGDITSKRMCKYVRPCGLNWLRDRPARDFCKKL